MDPDYKAFLHGDLNLSSATGTGIEVMVAANR